MPTECELIVVVDVVEVDDVGAGLTIRVPVVAIQFQL